MWNNLSELAIPPGGSEPLRSATQPCRRSNVSNPKPAALPRATVVRIGTGARHEAAIAPSYPRDQVWFVPQLHKDQPPENRYPDGSLANGQQVFLSDFALVDLDREAKADIVRAWIAGLREQVGLAEEELCALYREKE